MDIGIIGKGSIGLELYKKVIAKGWNVSWIAGSQGIFSNPHETRQIENNQNYAEYMKDTDLVFLAIPTLDHGEKALRYIKTSLAKKVDVPIVTCEKGALSNYFSQLEEAVRSKSIGYSATVGGGSRLLGFLEDRVNSEVQEIHAVVNGTLNYIFDGLSKGRSLGEVAEETKKLGYAEPGAKHPLDVINQEATGDVPMKASILFNICNLSKSRMRARDVVGQRIEIGELKKLVREASNRRYIVSITREENREEDVIWGFKHKVDDWFISAGFKHVEDNPLFRELIPSGVNNAVVISEGEFGKDGSYFLKGPGAGPSPTASSMLRDAEIILE